MSVPAGLYATLRIACERGQTTQLALDNSLAKKRLTEDEHAELSGILDAALNPPPAPEPEPTPDITGEPAEEETTDGTGN